MSRTKNNVIQIGTLVIPVVVGGLSLILTSGALRQFASYHRPAMTPSPWLFATVWMALYILLGVAAFLVLREEQDRGHRLRTLIYLGTLLIFQFIWSLLFFNAGDLLPAFLLLTILWILQITATVFFGRVDGRSGLLMVPGIIWIAFTGYLNLAIDMMSRTPAAAL